MKIGFVLDDTLDKPDGVQQYVLTLGGWLASQGHTVHYLVGQSSRQDVGTLHSLSKNVKVTFNGNRLTIPLPANNKAISKLLTTEQYDVLHVQMPYSPMLAHKIIRFAPPATAIVGTFHILPQTRLVRVATHALSLWLRRSLRRFDEVFAVSAAARVFAMQAFGLSQVKVLPNVVELQKFKAGRMLPQFQTGVPVIMFLGRLVPRKGCTVFLNALADFKTQHPDLPFRAVVCGKGPLQAELQTQANRLKIGDNVSFAGFIDEADKPDYIASADIIAFPSNGGESFGIVLAEAMATGRPIVLGGDNPGYRSVLEERPELLFDPHDHQALSDLFYVFLTDDKHHDDVISWQQHHVAGYDVAVVGPQLLDAYRQAITGRPKTS